MLGAAMLVAGIGLVMVASASSGIASANYNDPFHFIIRQGIFLFVGAVAASVAMIIPMEQWERWSWMALAVSGVLLFVVLFVGREINGSTRWLPFGFFNLQPSEVAKVLVAVYMASYLARRQDDVRGEGWWGFSRPMLVLSIALALLLFEPDFGSSVVLLGAVMGMVFLAGAGLGKFFVIMAGAVLGAVALVFAAPYRLRRLAVYTDPWADQFGDGYQLTQSLIGFGRGGWTGEGLGNGIQKLFFLPEAHTDFIFSVVAEELGLIGSIAVIAILFFIAWRAVEIGFQAEKANQYFSAYLAYGLGLLFGSQVFINIGVSSGLLPTKGLALPFLSYGGSSLITNCLTIGLLMRIDFERRSAGAAVSKVKGSSHG
nr:putative lipid II flippase FtsW [Sansalvadorimonas sp. 2012CJ34-2]